MALESDELVDTAQEQNRIVAKNHLNYGYVQSKAMKFYRL
jgi:hypothetical protein